MPKYEIEEKLYKDMFEEFIQNKKVCKVGCVFPMVVVSILPHAKFGPRDHREHAPHFTSLSFQYKSMLNRRSDRLFIEIYNDYRNIVQINIEITVY